MIEAAWRPLDIPFAVEFLRALVDLFGVSGVILDAAVGSDLAVHQLSGVCRNPACGLDATNWAEERRFPNRRTRPSAKAKTKHGGAA